MRMDVFTYLVIPVYNWLNVRSFLTFVGKRLDLCIFGGFQFQTRYQRLSLHNMTPRPTCFEINLAVCVLWIQQYFSPKSKCIFLG